MLSILSRPFYFLRRLFLPDVSFAVEQLASLIRTTPEMFLIRVNYFGMNLDSETPAIEISPDLRCAAWKGEYEYLSETLVRFDCSSLRVYTEYGIVNLNGAEKKAILLAIDSWKQDSFPTAVPA
jgi:hypothetical protein